MDAVPYASHSSSSSLRRIAFIIPFKIILFCLKFIKACFVLDGVVMNKLGCSSSSTNFRRHYSCSRFRSLGCFINPSSPCYDTASISSNVMNIIVCQNLPLIGRRSLSPQQYYSRCDDINSIGDFIQNCRRTIAFWRSSRSWPVVRTYPYLTRTCLRLCSSASSASSASLSVSCSDHHSTDNRNDDDDADNEFLHHEVRTSLCQDILLPILHLHDNMSTTSQQQPQQWPSSSCNSKGPTSSLSDAKPIDPTTVVDEGQIGNCNSGSLIANVKDEKFNQNDGVIKGASPSMVVVVSVSGGCDSIGLLHILMDLVRNPHQHNYKYKTSSSSSSPAPPKQQQQQQHLVDNDNVTIEPNLPSSLSPQTTPSPMSFTLQCCDNDKHDTSSSIGGDSNTVATNRKLDLEIHVAHFDHCQRGKESDGDREFVERLAKEYGLAFHCFYWYQRHRRLTDQEEHRSSDQSNNNSNIHKDNDDNIRVHDTFSQEAARQWRMTELSQLVQFLTENHKRPGVILTAHHKDDSNETLLLKILRGVHLSNLYGIEPLTMINHQDNHHHHHHHHIHTTTKTALGRPLLRIKKSQLVDYLQSRQLTWREDASNQSDKYLRNRIRNELMPLLSDLVGGEDPLQKRIDNLAQQSQEINRYVAERASNIMETSASVTGNFFLLSDDDDTNDGLDFIHKQAIFIWANQVIQGHTISYDNFVRLCEQLTDYPANRQWTINVGGGWDIIRRGKSLHVMFLGNVLEQDTGNQWQVVTWQPWTRNEHSHKMSCSESGYSMPVTLPPELCLADPTNLSFVLVKSNVEGLLFTPPWRKTQAPLKLREFLRGQRVPLHLRDTVLTILAHSHSQQESDKVAHLVAVYVSESDRWVVDARFAPDDDKNEENQMNRIMLHWH